MVTPKIGEDETILTDIYFGFSDGLKAPTRDLNHLGFVFVR